MAFKYFLEILVLAVCVEFGSSIRCYECNSANNSMCLNPTIYDTETVQKYLRATSCDHSAFLGPNPPAAKQMFCRKIIQTILHKGHDAEVRVTRGCGWVRHHKDCYKADNEDHLETVCQCFTDDCNGAMTLKHSLVITFISLGLILLKYY
ncbi:uncharacterized protein LOC113394807 [Vanessa tameamea]|uniref:Uncharacterized protein LOC113394807 n=1 Tax=Vanessa tameamea TaxID=334116 RepID=A0A8B8HT49_VANTA|nr:uncharacterized protein LOC113394807 [Vanessa tameamea]